MTSRELIQSSAKLCVGTLAVALMGAALGIVSLKAVAPFQSVYAVSGPRPDRLVRRANILDEIRVQHAHARASAKLAQQYVPETRDPNGLFARDPSRPAGK